MLCGAPIANDEMEDEVAVPLLRVTGEPRLLPPSLNCTVPVGVPELGGAAKTVAVKVTAWPKDEGFADDETPVELPSGFSVCVNEELVLPVKLAFPM